MYMSHTKIQVVKHHNVVMQFQRVSAMDTTKGFAPMLVMIHSRHILN